jgi:hydroxymethylbilane synthase
MRPLRLATRTSELALAQTRALAARLSERLGVTTSLVPIRTRGDRLPGPLAPRGGKGLFVKELEQALREGRADLAVHSAKDLPAGVPEGLALVAFPESADPRDALVARRRGATLDGLPRGARVGTGSLRRAAQLLALRPDLEVVPLRGNVPTRLRRLERDDLDALVLACAGLERLGLAARIDERLSPERMLPAVGQGILALEGRAGDAVAEAAAALSDPAAAARATAERGVLAGLDADCSVPLAAFAEVSGERLRLRALLASPAGERLLRAEAEGGAAQAAALGAGVALDLLARGGAALLAALREEPRA